MTPSKNSSTHSTAPPIPAQVTGALATGTLLQPLNSSMIAVAIVAIGAQFGTSGVSWVISAMYIATAVNATTTGRLGALVGAKRVYLGGLALVAAGSIIGMLAPNIGWLIAAYAVLGTGISAQMPNAMTMVRTYAERYRRQTRSALTVLTATGQSVAALGPTVGGLLVGSLGWQSILWVNLPVVAISAASVLLADLGPSGVKPREKEHPVHTMFDLVGIALFLVTLTSTMGFLVSLRDEPIWPLLPAATAGTAVFVWWEMRAPEPFLDIRAIHRNHPLRATLTRSLVTQTAFYCIFFGIPQWLQYSRGMSATHAGLVMLPVAGVSVVATIVGAYTYRRYGARTTLLFGTAALAIGGLLIVFIERTTTPVVVLLLVAAVLGLPNGFNNIGNQNLINASTTVTEVGTAIGMYRTAQFIGANLAVVVLKICTGDEINDDGLHRTGWFIAATGCVLLIGIVFARDTMTPKRTHTVATL
ncbi:MFS transporter [Rhodococcus sp. NPDC056743]|uniref:MFS transporter n=1 Tax=Rhodococcus sp. NPDC056743 TaxID=3345934 RepID=UPI00366A8F22